YAPKLVVRLASSCAVEPNDSYDVVWDKPALRGLTLNDGFRMNLPLERLPPDVFKNIYHSLAQFFFYTNQYVTG
ncbi:MAG: hypothetical protein IKL97_00560, partial [Eggerthellaceae bacterium]|nr:hypothetical protein [Eggerthellaceae bacterium]